MDVLEAVFFLRFGKKVITGSDRREKQWLLLKLGEEEINQETINKELDDVLSANFEVFSELIEMRQMEEISEREFEEDILDLLSQKSEVLKEYIKKLKGGGKSSDLKNLVKKVSDMLSSKGEVGRVFKFLNELKMSEKVRKILEGNADEFESLFLTEDYEKILEELAGRNARLYSLWKRMSDKQKKAVIEKGKDILDKIRGGTEGTLGYTFSEALNEELESPAWKGFFRSFFYEGLWKPFVEGLFGIGEVTAGSEVRVKNASNYFYGRIGKVIKMTNKTACVRIDDEEIILPLVDIDGV